MRLRLVLTGIGLLLLFSFSGCTKSANKPNVLILTMDTLRADALGCYGNPNLQTPNLDRLAREGVLCEDAICQIPATLTSHTAIFTGRNPKTTGVRFRTAHVPDLEETLAERFQAHGYRTAAFISSYVLAPQFGLNQGFDRYELGSLMKDGQKIADERRAEDTINQAIAFLNEKQTKPFFLWIHLYDPHSPYDAPAPFSTMYDSDYQGPLQGTVAEVTRLNASHGKNVSERDLRHLRALYDGEVAYMDCQIGRLLTALEKIQQLDRTLIAALADHGENVGEGGRFFHGDDLYQPAVHIPLLMRYPKKIASGTRISQFVQSIDLFPTLLDVSGVPMISGIEGNSLISQIDATTEKQEPSETQPGFLETEADAMADSTKLYALRTEQYKFIDNSAHRRSDVPLGIFTEIPLKGPTVVLLRIKGDPSVRLMAHVRYRTQALYQSRDFQALATLNTTVIHAETCGVEPIQQEALAQKSFHPTPEGWRLQMTPDIDRLARNYGKAQGWPVDWMILEGVGVDASLPIRQKEGSFTIDQIELFAPSLRFPNSPRLRAPFWVLEDFESSQGLADSGEGSPHSIQSQWENEHLFGGRHQQKITIIFNDSINPNSVDELYDLRNDLSEKRNLLNGVTLNEENIKRVESCRQLLDDWISRRPGLFEIQPLDASHLEALQALGYSR